MISSIWLAVLAFFFYGFAGPFMKYAHESGVSTRDFIIIASLTTLVAGLCWPNDKTIFSSLFINNNFVITLIASTLLTGGFIFLNQALAVPLAVASVVFVISSSNPLLSTLINLFYLGEKNKVVVSMLISGSLLIIIGTILVVLSTKN